MRRRGTAQVLVKAGADKRLFKACSKASYHNDLRDIKSSPAAELAVPSLHDPHDSEKVSIPILESRVPIRFDSSHIGALGWGARR